ncbi:TonB-dependent receptor [Ilyomonas limi]|uniref:TonB-dependent receptor n=1 Tax=Ilyomonas limi TaxID=2575867 RepID=A0A4U3KVR7_9BACT|nr:TonB-dependent receptor [Ilyomonas limi]TKK65117.1 TonB-dependent receptor [Ilyomonas limi]
MKKTGLRIQIPSFVMKVALLYSFLTLGLTVWSFAKEADGQEVLDKKITISIKEENFKSALQKISQEAGVKFSYTRNTIPEKEKVSVTATDETLASIFNSLFQPYNIQFEAVGNQVILKKNGSLDLLAEQETVAAETNYFVLIRGTVTDAGGKPIADVSVIVKGTGKGTTTNASGEFTIDAETGDILEFSIVGYKPVSVTVGNNASIAVQMQTDVSGLGEVVVVGYGTQKKASVTGAVSTVKATDIESIPTSNLSNLLAGRLPGAQIINNSGFVGASSDILVRGVGSGNGGTYPLVVIDNVVSSRADFDALDPNEVESVTLLKDAATAAVYGARASNGVLLVTTRSGKSNQKAVFSYKSYFTTSTTTKPLQSFTATDELIYKNKQYKNKQELAGQPVGTLPYGTAAFEYYKDKSYQLMDDLWRNPTSQQHDLSVSGGSEQLSYFILGGFNQSKGSFYNTDYNRYNFRSKVDAKISDNLTIGLNLSGYRRTGDRFYWPYDAEESTTLQDFYRATFNWSRLYPFYEKADGTPTNRLDPNGYPVISGGWHPIELVYNGGYRNVVYNNLNGIFNIDLKIPFIKGLSTKALANYNVDTRNAKAFIKYNKAYTIQFKEAGPGLSNYEPAPINFDQQNIHNLSSALERITENVTLINSYQFDWFLNYARTFGKHDVSANLVYEQSENKSKTLNGSAGRLISSNYDQILAASPDAVDRYFDGGEDAGARSAWIGRGHYEYNNKYITEFAFRRDASYIFAPDKRTGFFPSASAAWRISKEKFFNISFINELKLRASVGTTGNDNIAAYQWQNNYVIGNSYVFGNNYLIGLSPSVLPNPDVTWEKTTSYNGGLDFTAMDGKLSGEFDYFKRIISDILGTRLSTLPGTLGATLPAVNYAKKDIHGFELALQYRNTIGQIMYSIGGNMGYARDKWVLVDEPEAIKGTWRSAIDQPSNRLYGYVSEGIIRDEKVVEALKTKGFKQFGRDPMIGALLFKDIRGANFSEGPDGKIDENDATYLSNNAIPRINYGVNLSAAWKGFRIDILLQGVGAYDKIVSTLNTSTGGVFQVDRPYFHLWTDAWSEDNPNGKYPKIIDWGYEEVGYAPSSFWIRSGAYLRLRNLNISYSFPKKWIGKAGIKQLQLFFTGTNLLTFSAFKEYDPEQLALDSYPIMKSFTGGLNINF